MIKLNAKGFLTPSEPIPCSLSDLKAFFVDRFESDTRQGNFDNYIRYSTALKALLGGIEIRQWINGSFVTKKTNPKDIDVVSFVSHLSIKSLGTKLNDFRPPESWNVFGIDGYIIENHPPKSKLRTFTQLDMVYWRNQFGFSKPNRNGVKSAKGFLEINY